ncbi:MAG: hypothetical protein VX278_11425 [Myxococcota bacterium]|nr:hypothetical protein [Myxococcota bacterium]
MNLFMLGTGLIALISCSDKSDDSDTDSNTDTGTSDTGATVDSDAAIGIFGNGAVEIPQGSTYLEETMDGIALWSMGASEIDLKNISGADVTINSIVLTPAEGVLEQEWLVTEPYASAREEMVVSDTVIAPDETFSFGLWFWPMEWGYRDVDVTINYDGSRSVQFTSQGRGRDPGLLFAEETLAETVWGESGETASSSGSVADTYMAGMTADPDGNVYILANGYTWSDSFSSNMVVASLDASGDERWIKEWDEDYRQSSMGDENTSEGAAGSIDYGSDGYVYTAMSASTSSANSVTRGWVNKIDPSNGAVVWSKRFLPRDVSSPLGKDTTAFSAVDASGTYVLAAGYTGWFDDPNDANLTSSDKFLIAAYDKSDGSVVWSYVLDIHEGYSDKAQAICRDASGNAYVAGKGNDNTIVLKMSGVDSTAPSFAWVAVNETVDVGSNYRHCDVDADGNAYLALDRGGLPSWFSAVRYNSDGSLGWAKTFHEANFGDNDNAWVARVSGDSVYFGGRISQGFDTVQGDGFLLKAATDGSYDWSAFYYGGKGVDDTAYHRIQGLEVDSDGSLLIGHSSTVVNMNFEHYWGQWYQSINPADFQLDPPECGDGADSWTDLTLESTLTTNASSIDGEYDNWVELTGYQESDADSSLWSDAPEKISVEDAHGRQGQGVENHILFHRIKVD